VIDQVKFEQLEKSGTVTEDAVTAGGGDAPCTTHVPRSEGAADFPAEEEVVVVGPSTVEVRSALHADAAAIAAARELDRKRDLFCMRGYLLVSDRTRSADTSPLTRPSFVPQFPWKRRTTSSVQLAIAESLTVSFTKLATVAVESTALSSARCCG
jgi:hypothetical protein